MTDAISAGRRSGSVSTEIRASESRSALDERRAAQLAFVGALALCLSIFSGNFTKIVPVVPVDRVVMAVFLVMAVRATWRRHLAIRPIHIVLVLQFLWVLASSLAAGSFLHSSGFYRLADEVAIPSLLFTLAPIAFGGVAERVILVRVIAITAIYTGLTSVFQAFGIVALVFPKYIASRAIPGEISRAVGPSLQVGSDGAMLIMCIAPLLWLLMRSVGVWRLLTAIALLSAVAGAFLTLTRSVWIGGILSFVLFALLTPAFRRFAVACAVGAVMVFFFVIALSPTLAALITGRVQTVRSIDDRSTTNSAAIKMFDDHPLFGIGWGTFLDHVDNYVRQPDLIPLTNTHIPAHNVILSRAAEVGFIGALLFVLALILGPALSFARGRRGNQSGWDVILLSSFAAWFVVAMLTPMGYAFPNYFLWLLAGIAGTAVTRRVRESRAGRVAAGPSPDPAGSA